MPPTDTDKLTAIEEAWHWTGIEPASVVGENEFGHLIVSDKDGAYWRLSPEELSCERIAKDRAAFERLAGDAAFLADWQMKSLVARAASILGPLQPGTRYHLNEPAALGGEFVASNLRTIETLIQLRQTGERLGSIQRHGHCECAASAAAADRHGTPEQTQRPLLTVRAHPSTHPSSDCVRPTNAQHR